MKFDTASLDSQGFNDDDASYEGSRYASVKAELEQNAYYLKWGAVGEPPLPVYAVTLGRILKGILPHFWPWRFKAATERAVDSHADMRWGLDRQGFRRLLHPNGVCLFGRWIIDQPNDYSGYFKQGSEALIIGRYSTCCTETRRGYARSLSLVGKLYPTQNEEDLKYYRTANFITQEDLGGEQTLFINDATLRNAPDVTPWRRGWGTPILLITGVLFKFVNVEPAIRQLHTIAELGTEPGSKSSTPQFMQLTVDPDQAKVHGDELDYRNEILSQFYDKGNNEKTGRKLVFNIEVTDQGERRGIFRQRWTFKSWKKIGRIEFTEAVSSYNGDFVIHFPHPSWRTDRNDPSTQVRRPRDR